MTNTRLSTAAALVFAVSLSVAFSAGCGTTDGNYQLATETRTVSPFTLVDANYGVEVTLKVDSAQTGDVSLDVSAESNLLNAVITSVANDKLSVGVDGSVEAHLPITVVGTVSDISGGQAHNGATIVLEGIDGETLALGSQDGATLTARGSVDSLSVTSTDGASIICGDLTATTAEVALNNGASATVCVSGQVTGSVDNGAGLTVLCGGGTSGVTTSNGGTIN